jgi:predicted aconitase with swiveling domain
MEAIMKTNNPASASLMFPFVSLAATGGSPMTIIISMTATLVAVQAIVASLVRGLLFFDYCF